MARHFYLTILVFLFCQPLNASHILGGELSYACLGNDNYRFNLTVYRDCIPGGSQFDSSGPNSLTGTVTVFSDNKVFMGLDLDNPIVSSIDLNESPHPCPSILNLCVEKGEYEFTISLPNNDETYTISYQRCCRNPSINNMVLSDETGMTFTIDINKEAQDFCNISPKFNLNPQPIICVNNPLEIDLSATDENEDKLIYSFCAPYSGGGLAGTGSIPGIFTDFNGVAPNPESPPPYDDIEFLVPNYSSQNPLAGDPIITIDSETGLITGTPKIIGMFVFGVCVEEYRNNVLLSTIRRDYQLNVTECDPSACNSISTSEADLINTTIQVNPNPTKGILNISLSNKEISSWKIFGLNGNLILNSAESNDEVNLTKLSSGLYFLQLKDSKGNLYVEKVVKI